MAPAKLPLVYSCSGCSNLAQTANQVAVELNREKRAEMSCIAGVGGKVPSLVKLATSGRKIIALDGCHLACCKNCLSQHDVKPEKHLILSDLGYKKRYHQDFNQKNVDEIMLLLRNLCHEVQQKV